MASLSSSTNIRGQRRVLLYQSRDGLSRVVLNTDIGFVYKYMRLRPWQLDAFRAWLNVVPAELVGTLSIAVSPHDIRIRPRSGETDIYKIGPYRYCDSGDLSSRRGLRILARAIRMHNEPVAAFHELVIAPLARAIQLWPHGFTHCDIKPHNVLCSTDDGKGFRVFLHDFETQAIWNPDSEHIRMGHRTYAYTSPALLAMTSSEKKDLPSVVVARRTGRTLQDLQPWPFVSDDAVRAYDVAYEQQVVTAQGRVAMFHDSAFHSLAVLVMNVARRLEQRHDIPYDWMRPARLWATDAMPLLTPSYSLSLPLLESECQI